MGKYSIKELEHLSGIKAHTIRIWEKRYSLIAPQRTDTNIRFYSDDDLKKIINVSLLNAHGLKISKIARMSEAEIARKVLALNNTDNDSTIHVNQLVVAMVQLDEEKFETALAGLFLRYNFEQTMITIVYPFLQKIGVLWQTHNISPAQEHFVSNLIRQKVIVGIDSLPLPSDSDRIAVLFLPERELHEIGLLFCHYLLRKAGYRTIYLGQAVPHADLLQIFSQYKPDLLVTVLTAPLPDVPVEDYLERLETDFNCPNILISGMQTQHLNYSSPTSRLRTFQNLAEFQAFIV